MTTVAEVDVKINAKLDSFLQSSKKAEKIINDLDKRLNKLSNKNITATVSTKVGSTKDLALLERRLNLLNNKKFNATVTPKVGSTADLARLEARLKRLQSTTALVNPNVSSGAAKSQMSNGSNLGVGSIIGGVGGYFTAKEVQEYADAWTSAGNKIRAAAEISGMQVRSLQELNVMANSTRSSLEGTVDLYAKLVRSSQGVAASELEVAKATETVTKAFKAGGSTTQEQIAGIVQLGQALGSGVLQGDELRSIRENAPLIAQAIAKEFKTTVGGLKKLGEEGELVAPRVFKAIINGSKDIDAAFNATNSTIADGFTRIKNALTEYIGTADKSNGATGMLVAGLTKLADNFETVADVTLKFAAVIASAFIGRAIGGMLASLGLATAQMFTFVRAISAARSAAAAGTAFAALGSAAGPIGAILGVAAGAALYFGSSALEAGDNSDKLREEMHKLGLLADDLSPKIDKVGDSLKNMTAFDTRKKLEEINAELDRMKGQSLKGMLGFASNDKKTLGDIQATLNALSGPRARVGAKEKNGASALTQLIADAESGNFTLKEIEDRLNEIGKVKINDQFDDLISSLRKILPYMKSLRDYSNEIFQPQKTVSQSSGVISEGTSSERLRREQEAWIEQQKAIELRSDKEKEIAKITEKLLKDAKEAGVAMTEAVASQAANEIYTAKENSKSIGTATDLIKKFEGFQSTAYWDVNAFRAGFGSDTVTLSDDSIVKVTKGMTVSLADANRDLDRRILEFQKGIERSIGKDTFGSMNQNQQAALTSIAYNYGSLPERLVEAIRTGSAENIYTTIRALGNDNGGINRGRRNQEADLYVSGLNEDVKKGFESKENFAKSLKQKQQELEFLKEETALRGQLNPLITDYGGRLSALQAAQELLTMSQNEGTTAGKELSSVQQLLYGDLSKLSPEARAQAEAMRTLAISQGEATEAGNRLKESQSKLAGSMQETSQFGKDILGGFISDLKDGKSATEALANALSKVADKLLDVGLDALFGLGNFSGKGGSPLGGLFNTIFGGLFGGFRADGGSVSSSKGYVVGENGPEWFQPDTAGSIVPNDKLSTVNVPQGQLKPSVGGNSGPTSVQVEIVANTDTGVITEIADARVRSAAPTIVKTSVQQSQKETKKNLGSYMTDTQMRKM